MMAERDAAVTESEKVTAERVEIALERNVVVPPVCSED